MEPLKTDSPIRLPLTLSILARMRQIDGWMEDDEADLLIAAASWALGRVHPPHALVEVGSYCGRSTVVLGSVAAALSPTARVYAIDPHRGDVGASGEAVHSTQPTLQKFRDNIAAAGLTGVVEAVAEYSFDVVWDRPITMLLVDGLHDYENVSRDFRHFERWVVPGGCAAFHDYAEYYPGVMKFVNELLSEEKYEKIGLARSMIVVRRRLDDEG